MKATIDRLTLKDAVTEAKRSVGRKATLPAIRGIRMDAQGDTLTLSATDLSVSTTVTLAADVHDAGTVLIDAKLLAGLVSNGPDTLTFAGDAGTLDVHGDATATVRLMEHDDYPALPTVDGDCVDLDADTVARMASVAGSASSEQARPVLTGVLIDGGHVAATDSYRLAWTPIDGDLGPALIPAAAVSRAARWKADVRVTVEHAAQPCNPCGSTGRKLVGGDGVGALRYADCRRCDGTGSTGTAGTVAFTATVTRGPKRAPRTFDVTLVARTIDGSFPNWRQLVPEAVGDPLTVDTAEMVDAIKALAPVTSAHRNTPVHLSVDEGDLVLTACNQEIGDVSASVLADDGGYPWTHTPSFNPGFLRAALETVDGERTVLACRDGLKPLVVTADDSPTSVLLMPVRTN